MNFNKLSDKEGKLLETYFDTEIAPYLSANIISKQQPFPFLKNKEIYGKYIVFRDLKDRGYVIKTGFKYGSDFRLYNRGGGPGKGHSDYLVKIIYETYEINALDFSSYVRVSHGVNKKLLLAIVDDDLDITYYNVEWTRP